MIQKGIRVDVLQRTAFLVFTPPELIDAVVGCYLGNPRAERDRLLFLVPHSVKLQEDFSCGIFSVFVLTEKTSADLQNVAIVGNVENSQKF